MTTIRADIDISIVMNVHRSHKYYRRTILSLEAAVRYAVYKGILIELIVVMDSPDPPTTRYFQAYRPELFCRYELLSVNNKALGLSRNDGVHRAAGRFIMTFDDDDLISFNYIVKMFQAASANEKVVAFPEYLYGFGDGHQLCKYYTFNKLSRLIFIESHALMSRFIAYRDVFDEIQYNAVSIGDALGYEDWHFNCEIIARGLNIVIAEDTVLFYRERHSGSAWKMASQSVGQIPQSKLFLPNIYLDVCSEDYFTYNHSTHIMTPPSEILTSFTNNFVISEALVEASQIDPSICVRPLHQFAIHCNKDRFLGTGAAYYEVCELVKDRLFDHVLIVPFLTLGEESRTIHSLLSQITQNKTEPSVLILSGHGGYINDGVMNLPEQVVFIDLFNMFEGLSYARLFTVAFKLIQASAAKSELHLIGCKFSCDFFRSYHPALSGHRTKLYCPSEFDKIGSAFGADFSTIFSFIDRHSEYIDNIATDQLRLKDVLKTSCGIEV
ncbi:glycosyltransferase [Methylobacterium phyllosphaerae]